MIMLPVQEIKKKTPDALKDGQGKIAFALLTRNTKK